MDSPLSHSIFFKHFKLFVEPTTNKQTPMAMLQKKVSDWQTIQEAWIHNSMVIMVTSKKSSLTAIINILLYYLHGIVIQENTVTNLISCSTPWFGFDTHRQQCKCLEHFYNKAGRCIQQFTVCNMFLSWLTSFPSYRRENWSE